MKPIKRSVQHALAFIALALLLAGCGCLSYKPRCEPCCSVQTESCPEPKAARCPQPHYCSEQPIDYCTPAYYQYFDPH